MIKLAFAIGREVFSISIENRQIWYRDRKWQRQIRLIPKDERFVMKVRMSRNKIPQLLVDLFNLTKAEQEEYDNAKTDEELAEIVIKECKMKGGRLLKRESG